MVLDRFQTLASSDSREGFSSNQGPSSLCTEDNEDFGYLTSSIEADPWTKFAERYTDSLGSESRQSSVSCYSKTSHEDRYSLVTLDYKSCQKEMFCYTSPVIITTDASALGWGAHLQDNWVRVSFFQFSSLESDQFSPTLLKLIIGKAVLIQLDTHTSNYFN